MAPTPDIEPIEHPGRPARPRLVAPKDVARRSLNTERGRAALIHAITHIEFNAINLALDALYRFQGLPRALLPGLESRGPRGSPALPDVA